MWVFFKQEVGAALRSPMVYIFMGIMALLVFGANSSDSIVIGGTIGSVHRNAPFTVMFMTGILSLFGLLFAAAFFNNAALRDYQHNFNEILFSSPVGKRNYFLGRFFGALLLSTLPLVGIFFGFMLAQLIAPAAGWMAADRFGPTPLSTFFNAYFLFILPNMFVAGAIIFALSNWFKSTVISFVGAMAIIMAYLISGSFLSDIENETIAALTDIFGLRAYSLETKYFTPAQKNEMAAGFDGMLAFNRLVWVVIGFGMLAVSFFTASIGLKKVKAEKKSKVKVDNKVFTAVKATIRPRGIQQFMSFFKSDFRSIIRSNVFVILFLFSLIMLVSNLVNGYEYFGLQSYPVTYKVLGSIENIGALFIMITLVFFSGELVWRDRTSHINEVIDATPHPAQLQLMAKALSLVTVVSILHWFFVIIGIGYQATQGYFDFELNVYTKTYLIKTLPTYTIWAFVLLFLQTIINQKYISYFAAVMLLFVLDLILLGFDIGSNMIAIGSGPSIRYSDMNEFGPGLYGRFWFTVYWALLAVSLLLFSGMIWSRGAAQKLGARWQAGKKSLSGGYRIALLGFVALWLVSAGFVYYNTQIKNPYMTGDEQKEAQVSYENKYKRYQDLAMPKLIDAKFDIQIFPAEERVVASATQVYENKSTAPIDTLVFTSDEDWHPEITIPNAELITKDEEIGFRIFHLTKPLAVGEKISIDFNTWFDVTGFENNARKTSVVKNGTFFNHSDVLPMMGYLAQAEMSDKNDRKKYGLPEKARMPALQTNCNHLCNSHYLNNSGADLVTVETTISTSGDQIAIAPGSLQREWQEGGRNHYHYKVDHPSLNFYSFVSARYEVARRKWKDVDMEVYYHPTHDTNIEKMLDAIEHSLEYYTENFGPYYHKQARIIEFPRYASFAQAFPGTMPYSEALGFIVNLEDESDNNVVEAVIAHEMAHQWWAHQVIGAEMQGGTMMSESFAEYSSLMVMKKSRDAWTMKKFLKYDLERYLKGRSRETEKEVPLYKVQNQPYIHYGKGAIVLYGLQHYIGEDSVNAAMKEFLEQHRYKGPPYPTSHDFLKVLELKVPEKYKYLIQEWFKEITLYDLRLEEATYAKSGDKYQVNLAIKASKIKADSAGNETTAAINDWVEIAIFKDREQEDLIYFETVHMTTPEVSLSFEIEEKPVQAVIDPKRILIEKVTKDNKKSVKAAES